MSLMVCRVNRLRNRFGFFNVEMLKMLKCWKLVIPWNVEMLKPSDTVQYEFIIQIQDFNISTFQGNMLKPQHFNISTFALLWKFNVESFNLQGWNLCHVEMLKCWDFRLILWNVGMLKCRKVDMLKCWKCLYICIYIYIYIFKRLTPVHLPFFQAEQQIQSAYGVELHHFCRESVANNLSGL